MKVKQHCIRCFIGDEQEHGFILYILAKYPTCSIYNIITFITHEEWQNQGGE